MKAISVQATLTSASTRADGSLGLRFATPELKPEEKTAFFEIANRNVIMLLQPYNETPEELITVAKELNTKTPSQRLRAVLYIEWKQHGEKDGFEEYYQKEMDRIIEYRKTRLEPQA